MLGDKIITINGLHNPNRIRNIALVYRNGLEQDCGTFNMLAMDISVLY